MYIPIINIINTTIIATTDGAYQPALDQALAAGGADAPDIYCAEAAFVLKYTQGSASQYAMPYADLGIDVDAALKEADIAQYTIDVGTNPDGKLVGLGYQASGGAFIYRRSIAKDVWGTDDPAEIAGKIGPGWDKFFEAAEALKEKGYGIVSGDGDIWHAVENSSDAGWIVDGKLNIDPKREEFLTITRTSSYSFGDTEGLRSFTVGNKNAFLTMMEGALSGKTGFTNNAGYCYVGALKREDRTFIVALLACGWPNNRSYKWSDTRKLMSYGLEHYEYRDVWEEPSFGTIPVKGGIPESGSLEEQSYTHIALAPGAETTHRKLLLSEQEQITIETNLPEELSAPIEPGTIIGSVRYYLNGDIVQIYPITATDKVDPISLPWCLKKILTTYQL